MEALKLLRFLKKPLFWWSAEVRAKLYLMKRFNSLIKNHVPASQKRENLIMKSS
jgi:hypothetical protein